MITLLPYCCGPLLWPPCLTGYHQLVIFPLLSSWSHPFILPALTCLPPFTLSSTVHAASSVLSPSCSRRGVSLFLCIISYSMPFSGSCPLPHSYLHIVSHLSNHPSSYLFSLNSIRIFFLPLLYVHCSWLKCLLMTREVKMSRNKVRSRVEEPASLDRELTRLEEMVPCLKHKDNQMVIVFLTHPFWAELI